MKGIFDGRLFSRSQRGQVVILSPPGSSIAWSESHLEVAGDVTRFTELARAGAVGVLLPGVDGDVAGLYSFTTSTARCVRARLEEEARRVGVCPRDGH